MLTLDREQLVPRPRSEVFAFFADATNLERITPEFLRFRVTTPQPITIAPGTLIDYRLGLFGIPFRWRTLIETFEPETRFVDRQLKGPYAHWVHTHTFEDAPGGTLMRDHLEYAIPFGPLGAVARVLFVERTVAKIFDYRRDAITRLFPAR
ncbi:MAG: cyclase/dehydrase [Labilithrix sp.]|nr:cyclase/dehydrase [Labilithrix sp.]